MVLLLPEVKQMIDKEKSTRIFVSIAFCAEEKDDASSAPVSKHFGWLWL